MPPVTFLEKIQPQMQVLKRNPRTGAGVSLCGIHAKQMRKHMASCPETFMYSTPVEFEESFMLSKRLSPYQKCRCCKNKATTHFVIRLAQS